MIVAIHQPNYFPWLGYFNKVLSCDVFVFLDHVQFMHDGSYTQRVAILTQKQPAWLSVPVLKRGRFAQSIADVRCNTEVDWRRKHLKTLEASYGRHAFFPEVREVAASALSCESDRLADINVAAVQRIASRLGATCRFVRSSALSLPDLKKDELLAAITKEVGGTKYLYGATGGVYQDASVFEAAGVIAVPQAFQHPTYEQRGADAFIPKLSILDALFNVGFEHTRSMLTAGSRALVGAQRPEPA